MSNANNCGICDDDDKGVCELLHRHTANAKANTLTRMPSEQTLHLDPQRVIKCHITDKIHDCVES